MFKRSSPRAQEVVVCTSAEDEEVVVVGAAVVAAVLAADVSLELLLLELELEEAVDVSVAVEVSDAVEVAESDGSKPRICAMFTAPSCPTNQMEGRSQVERKKWKGTTR